MMTRRDILRWAARLPLLSGLLLSEKSWGAVVWDTAQYESAYRTAADDPATGRYDRTFPPQSMYQRRCDKFIELATLAPISQAFQASDRILIGGCGFGQTVDCFLDAGFSNTFGVDGGPHIAANSGDVSPGTTVLLEDIRGGGQFRASLRNNTGDDVFDWIISESMLESAETDNEVLAAISFIQGISHASTIALHAVVPLIPGANQDPVFTWKSMADWRTLLDSDNRTQANGHFLVDLTKWGVW